MGLLENLAGSVLGGSSEGAGGNKALLGSLMEMLGGAGGGALGGLGGLAGLVQAFQRSGLGHLTDSWVGTGQNQPVAPEQVQQALGPQVQDLAQRHGMSTGAVSQALSQLLPHLVDRLTPQGQLPQGGPGAGLSGLRSQLGL